MNTPTFPKLGEVWYVNLPNQPADPHQPRTAIVVSTNGRNQGATDVVVIPTTSAKISPHPDLHIQIPKGQGGLAKDSIARCEQVTTLDKRFLVKGPLADPIHISYSWKIIHAVRRALGDTTV
jgi:mRNA interferase MazF